MKHLTLFFLFLVVPMLAAFSFRADQPVLPEGGSVAGTCTLVLGEDEELPELDEIAMDKDTDICVHDGGNTTLARDLLVDPETLAVTNVYVSIEKVKDGLDLEVPEEPLVLDQVACRFEPHVSVVPAGQTVRFANSDDATHNVSLTARKNDTFNEGIPAAKHKDWVFKKSEKVEIACTIHPWMKAYLVVTEHPYYSLTLTDGKFRIDGLPAGEWQIRAWHERFGTFYKDMVTVTDGAVAEVNIDVQEKKKR